jgi:hypothetical protein
MNQLLDILKSAAPGLATLVAGPVGGMAVKAIASKFGVEDTVEAVTAHLQANPDDALKLKEIDLKQFELENQDRDSARKMQIAALGQDDKEAKNFIYRFAWFWSITSVIYFFCVTFVKMPEGSRDFANIILGFILGTAIASIFNFFYGSSKSSKDKTDAMSKGFSK